MRLAPRRTAVVATGAVLLLAACGVASPTPSAEQKPVALTFQIRYPPESARGQVIQAMVDAFHQKHPQISVRLIGAPYAADKLAALATSVDAPDVMQVPEEAIAEFGEKGVFGDLTDKVKDQQSAFTAPVWDLAQSGGKTYALPWFGQTMQLIYSRAAFRAAGLDPGKPPATWEDLFRTAQTLTKGSQFGFGLVGKQHHDLVWQWEIFLWQAGGELVKKQGDKWRVALNSPAGLRALQFYLRMKSVAEPEVASATATEVGNLFVSKRVAMQVLGPAALADAWKGAADIDATVAPLPRDQRPATVYLTENLVLFRGSKHPTESLELMRFLAGPDAAKLLLATDGGRAPFGVPVLKSVESAPFLQKDYPSLRPFLQGFAYGLRIYPIPGWSRVHQQSMQLHLNKAILGQETPENALAAIEKEGNAILDQIYRY